MHSVKDRVTDGRTDDMMMPIADHRLLCSSTIGEKRLAREIRETYKVRKDSSIIRYV